MSSPKICEHLVDFQPKVNNAPLVCKECVENGDKWVHLRICQTCGDVFCCDSSPNKHATRHWIKTGHSVVISGERGEKWAWCYDDDEYLDY
ncbi:MAG TPA: UBP-type zinc finger domain-containing protein [Cytophagaceae bacterium]|jgi:uncharacterized UBP type Zn finger protein